MGTIAYENPVFEGSFADPFVWRSDGVYYAVGTGQAEAEGHVGSSAFPLLTSPDLVHWRALGAALERPDAALGDTLWAPEVAFRDGRFFLYYSVGWGDREHQLRVAAADRPAGPYHDVAALTDVEECPFAIDPHPFHDEDGRDYLFFAVDFIHCEDGMRAGTALVVQELADMTRLVGRPSTVARARWDWQRFASDRAMYGSTYDWHTLEGPAVLVRDGVYYCMYSGGCWYSPRYGVDYVTATSIQGPWIDESIADGPRVLRGVEGRFIGPGHHSVVLGPNGVDEYVCYHAWDAAMTQRRMCIDKLLFTADGPVCDGPSCGPRELEL